MMNNKDFPVWEVSQLAEKESWRKEINRPIGTAIIENIIMIKLLC